MTSASVHSGPPWETDTREKIAMPRSSSEPVTCPATSAMYTACPVPIGARESKTTALTAGRTARLHECLASGSDTQ